MSSNRAAAMNPGESKPIPVFLLAIWFGAAAGLLEALNFLIFEYLGFLSWNTGLRGVFPDILWASPLMDAIFLLALTCLVKPMMRPLGRHGLGVVITVFATVGFYAVLGVSGRLKESGALIAALGLGTVVSRWVRRDPDRKLQILRRSFRPLVATTALVCLGVVAGAPLAEKIKIALLPAPPRNAPNVLLIVLDTLRADRLGSYGYPLHTTPFLDRYSREAVLFEKAFATAPWTLPSHVSMFTGYLPSVHGATLYPYDGRFPTLGQEMAAHGYATAGIVANIWFGSRAQGFARGFIHWENGFTGIYDSAVRTSLGRRIIQHFLRWFTVPGMVDHILAGEVNRRCLNWLDSRPDRPFFLFLNYMDVHDPLFPPRNFAEKFSAQPEIISPALHVARNMRGGKAELFDFPRMNEAYDASLASLDEQLEKLFGELHRRDLERNTLVIIVSDHGESLGQHGFPRHWSSVYREQIQVPLLVRLPGVTPAGRRIAEVAGLENLPATIAELIALPDSPFPGTPLSRWWQGSAPEKRLAVSELDRYGSGDPQRNGAIAHRWLKSVTDDHWHFILQEGGKRELFNLDADPKEEKDLGGLAESQARMEEMRHQLEIKLGAGPIHLSAETPRQKP
jgi:arylsulfatase A-like enzyme